MINESLGTYIGNFGGPGIATVDGAGLQLNSSSQLVVGSGGPGP